MRKTEGVWGCVSESTKECGRGATLNEGARAGEEGCAKPRWRPTPCAWLHPLQHPPCGTRLKPLRSRPRSDSISPCTHPPTTIMHDASLRPMGGAPTRKHLQQGSVAFAFSVETLNTLKRITGETLCIGRRFRVLPHTFSPLHLPRPPSLPVWQSRRRRSTRGSLSHPDDILLCQSGILV